MVSNSDEDRLLYLLSGSCEVLPSSYIKLRSYLNIHSAKLADRQNVNIFKSRQTYCPYCYSAWTCDTSSFKLLPSKKLKAKKSEKRVNGQKEGASESRNVLVLKCKVCTKKSSFSLVKKQKVQEKVPVEEENEKVVKKKKKKKDRSCGLRGVLVNSEKTIGPSPQLLGSKAKEGLISAKDHHKRPPQKNSPKLQTKSPVNSPNPKCKLNPFSQPGKELVNSFSQAHNKLMQMKKQQKLKKLQRATKTRINVPKKTLQDFLTLI